ncbi:MAG: glycoside hydrolase family 25 protein [Rhabdochlamydiaceae bacterium]
MKDIKMINGIDISHFNQVTDFSAVAKAGIDFAFVKATDGTDFIDPKLEYNFNGCRDAGIITGIYHFYRPDKEPVDQAFILNKIAKKLNPAMIAVDVEPSGNPDGWLKLSPQDRATSVKIFLGVVQSNSGKKPILYSTEDFLGNTLSNLRLDMPLWLARWSDKQPEKKWTFWQNSNSGKIPGIVGPVDTDQFNGTAMDLSELNGQLKLL